MLEIRMHGLGGHGTVATAELLGLAGVNEGMFAQSLPFFSPDIRGGTVTSFVRLSDRPIRVRSYIHNPDMIVLFGLRLLTDETVEGAKKETIALVNAPPPTIIPSLGGSFRVIAIDAEGLAASIPGCRMFNAVMLGAAASLSAQVTLGSVEMAIRKRFLPELAEINVEAARLGFQAAETKVA